MKNFYLFQQLFIYSPIYWCDSFLKYALDTNTFMPKIFYQYLKLFLKFLVVARQFLCAFMENLKMCTKCALHKIQKRHRIFKEKWKPLFVRFYLYDSFYFYRIIATIFLIKQVYNIFNVQYFIRRRREPKRRQYYLTWRYNVPFWYQISFTRYLTSRWKKSTGHCTPLRVEDFFFLINQNHPY